jgi:hypothetical protein
MDAAWRGGAESRVLHDFPGEGYTATITRRAPQAGCGLYVRLQPRMGDRDIYLSQHQLELLVAMMHALTGETP